MTPFFLSPTDKVIPLQDNDYSDWHQGRAQFGLWYIMLSSPTIIDYCQTMQAEFSQFLQPDYQRQFHITIFVTGFWVKNKQLSDDFDYSQLNLHIQSLKNLSLSPFTLTLSTINSFKNVLFIHVLDNHQHLSKIRQVFHQIIPEISPPSYYPHITLGFYRQDFLARDIYHHIQQVTIKNLSFTVDKLIFGTYQSNELQGKLTPVFEFLL